MAIRSTSIAQDKSLAVLIQDSATIAIDMDATSVLEWVADNFEPDEVFDDDKLVQWAEDSGYIKDNDHDR